MSDQPGPPCRSFVVVTFFSTDDLGAVFGPFPDSAAALAFSHRWPSRFPEDDPPGRTRDGHGNFAEVYSLSNPTRILGDRTPMSASTPATAPAFPSSSNSTPGLSVREYFACHLMAAVIASRATGSGVPDHAARLAVQAADALLAALADRPEQS